MSKPGKVQGVSRLCPRDAKPDDDNADTRDDNLLSIERCSGEHPHRPRRGRLENPCRPSPLG